MRKFKMKQCDVESPANGGETAPVTLQESEQSALGQKILGDVLDVIINISDEEWMSFTKDMNNVLTKMEFAHLCSAISKFATKQYHPTLKKSDAASTSSSGKNIQIDREARETSNPDAAAVTGKIVMVVLDVMDGSSTAKVDLKQTGDLLMAAAERMKRLASRNSEERLTSRTLFLGAQKAQEEFQTKATRAVSQELLSHISVWEMDGSSELPNSLGSQLAVDSELGAMTQAKFPTDSVLRLLDSTSREIVQTIAENMDVLSSASDSHSEEHSADDSGLCFDINRVFSTINQNVTRFFHVAKHLGKEYSEVLRKIHVSKMMDLDEMQVAQPSSSTIYPVSQSASLHSGVQSDNVGIWTSSSIRTIKSGRILTKATQAVSDFLVSNESRQTSRDTTIQTDWDLATGPCSPSTSCSSGDLHSVAASIAGTVVHVFDGLVESRVMDSNRDIASIVSALDSFSFVSPTYSLGGSDIPNVGCYAMHYYRWVMHDIMQERTTCSTSSSRSSVTNSDLGGRNDISLSTIDSDFDDDIPLDCSSDQVEDIFSSQFQKKATQVVSHLHLATGEKLAAYMQCSVASSPVVSNTHVHSTLEEVTEPPSVAAPFSSTKANSAASETISLSLKRLPRLSSSDQSDNATDEKIHRIEESDDIMGTVTLDRHAEAMRSEMRDAISSSDVLDVFVDTSVVGFPSSEEDAQPFRSDCGVLFKRLASVPKKLRRFFTSLNTCGHLEVKASDIKNDRLKIDSSSTPCSSGYEMDGSTTAGVACLSNSFSGRDTPTSSAGVGGQQMDISGLTVNYSVTSVTALRAASALVEETLDTLSISSHKSLSHRSSTSSVNRSCSMDPVPVNVKRRHLGFPFFIHLKKTPKICVHWKKSNKVNPICLVSDDHKPCSSSGHLQESSHLEPRVTTSSSRKMCPKLLSRMCLAISKALPNPFKCMARRPP